MPRSKDRFYITTAIDYVNSLPHIGTAYEKIGADALARYHRMRGFDVHFQMGNDEHSLNVIKAAVEKKMDPKSYCDEMRKEFEHAWEKLEIEYDGFIQTSEDHHHASVQRLFAEIEKNGDIYEDRYEGWYCEGCEAYLTEKDLVDGKCPQHRTKPTWLEQDNYFFKLSKYRDKLLQHMESNPNFIVPPSRRNEIVSFLKEGLNDISVSRAGGEWGVKLPNDDSHVVYVWFDALINYITAVGYGWGDELFSKWWPADVHVIGKDIIRFHCIIWPAMLMSAGVELPKTILVHGFITSGGEKMSKSLGNVVRPMEVVDRYGADALRYYLLRQGPFSHDIDFTWDNFTARYNGDLANGIGNLVSRTVGMASKYVGGKIERSSEHVPDALHQVVGDVYANVLEALDHESGGVEFNAALAHVWEVMAVADRYINDTKPWALAKQGRMDEVSAVLAHCAEAIRHIAILAYPFIPTTAAKIWEMMGFDAFGSLSEQRIPDKASWTGLPAAVQVKPGEGLFPRIEKKEQVQIEDKAEKKQKQKTKAEEKDMIEIIDIADFGKVDLRVAEVTAAERVEGTDKLMKIQVNLGEESGRQIVAGIAQHYTPEELTGKKIVVVANLKPAKLRGIESQGMLLAASDSETISILTPLKDVAIGSKVK
jgi:methionyl-tRNA synthetase